MNSILIKFDRKLPCPFFFFAQIKIPVPKGAPTFQSASREFHWCSETCCDDHGQDVHTFSPRKHNRLGVKLRANNGGTYCVLFFKCKALKMHRCDSLLRQAVTQ